MPGIACGRCYGTCATIATLRRPSSVDAAILRGALLRSCLAGRATRGRPRDSSALATPASIVILAIELPRIVTGSNAVALMMSRAPRHCQRPLLHQIAQFARTGVLALLYRSVYRIKEPRQQPNEDSQRGPRPRVPALFARDVRRADRAPLGPVPDVPRALCAAAGHAAVVQIVSTGEALMERRLAEIPTDEWDVEFKLVAPRNTTVEAACRGGVLARLVAVALLLLQSTRRGTRCAR